MPIDYGQFMEGGGEKARKKDPRVSYMALKEEAGAFSCGNCTWLDGTYCENRLVRADVLPDHGCCNLFSPGSGLTVIFP